MSQSVVVRIIKAEGSTPRNAGAAMLVTPHGFKGTIGGGTLEWLALAEAQKHAAAAGRTLPSPVVALQRFTQRSVKLLRWLRSSLQQRLDWHTATPHLALLYATL